MVSGNYFHVLGVEPRLGRGFREDEDQVPGRDAVVVLGPDFWKHEFASDPVRRGQDGSPERHGVHRDWRGSGNLPGDADIRASRLLHAAGDGAGVFDRTCQKNFFEDRDDRELNVKARLKPGTTLQQARNELAVLAKNFERDYPKVESQPRRGGIHAVPNADPR